ncbi:hypothetical protein C942_04345 [Photobacterium marinum]|uniref:Uncharacterized protein n=1 Tax=Photobacterium marinum TaxID=1056511 RepID=L8JGU8_9GAMM|nr:hypothetical protein C942_04345 [Photobacterium marinum]
MEFDVINRTINKFETQTITVINISPVFCGEIYSVIFVINNN